MGGGDNVNKSGHQLILPKFHHWSRISTLLWSNPFPISKFHFLQIFYIIVESSLIAQLTENFILKSIKTGYYLINLSCEEIWRNIDIWRHRIRRCRHIFSPISWKKYQVLMFFSIKFTIDRAINKLSTIILKTFKNWSFNGRSK